MFTGPQIVTNGLVLYLDAGNTKSLSDVPATNLLKWSDQFDNTNWVKSNAIVTANMGVSPDGTLTADLIDDGIASNTQHWFYQNPSLSYNTTYTISIFVKYISRKYMTINIYNGITSQYVDYDIQNGTIFGSVGDVTATIQNYGNSWYRLTYTRTIASSGSPNYRIAMTDDVGNETYTGSNKQTYVWGAQLETGPTATTYIPTTSTAASRVPAWTDISKNGNNGTLINGVGYNGANGGSLTFDGVDDYVDCGNNPSLNITGPISIECVFKDPNTANIERILTKEKTGGSFGSGYQISKYTSNRILVTYNNISTRIYLYSINMGYGFFNKFNHIIYTYNGTNSQQIWINGEDKSGVGEFIDNFTAGDNLSAPITIMKRGTSDYAEGESSIIKIYNRALSDQEVLQNFNATKSRFGL